MGLGPFDRVAQQLVHQIGRRRFTARGIARVPSGQIVLWESFSKPASEG
jgi:hypothetical protein